MRFAATQLATFFEGQTLQLTDGGIWVPLPMDVLEPALDHLQLGSNDVVLDAGMGDGRLVAGLCTRGVRAYGIEIDEHLARLAADNLEALEERGLPRTYRVRRGDFLELSAYEGLDIDPTDIDVFLNYADGNEQALAGFVRDQARSGGVLALITADLTLAVAGLTLDADLTIERAGNRPPLRLIVYRS